MQKFVIDNKINFKKGRNCLIDCLHAEKVIIATPLLRWLLRNGLIVTNIYRACQWVPKKLFEPLIQEFTNIRREASKDKAMTPWANLAKLSQNS